MTLIKKYGFHLFLWGAMLVYFFVAPDIVSAVFTRNGKPLRSRGALPAQASRITFVVEDLVPSTEDGEPLYILYGWSFIAPGEDNLKEGYEKEVVLVSEKRQYFFAAQPVYRDPGPASLCCSEEVDLDTLGYRVSISENTIRPGKYRIGILYRSTTGGPDYYWDKPARYLVKTPNTIRLEKK